MSVTAIVLRREGKSTRVPKRSRKGCWEEPVTLVEARCDVWSRCEKRNSFRIAAMHVIVGTGRGLYVLSGAPLRTAWGYGVGNDAWPRTDDLCSQSQTDRRPKHLSQFAPPPTYELAALSR